MNSGQLFAAHGGLPIYVQEDASAVQVSAVKEQIINQGGKVTERPVDARVIIIIDEATEIAAKLVTHFSVFDDEVMCKGVVDSGWISDCLDQSCLLGPRGWGGHYIYPSLPRAVEGEITHLQMVTRPSSPNLTISKSPSPEAEETLEYCITPLVELSASYPFKSRSTSLVQPISGTPQESPELAPVSIDSGSPLQVEALVDLDMAIGSPFAASSTRRPSFSIPSPQAPSTILGEGTSASVNGTAVQEEDEPCPTPPPTWTKRLIDATRYAYTDYDNAFIQAYISWAKRTGRYSRTETFKEMENLMPWHKAAPMRMHVRKLSRMKPLTSALSALSPFPSPSTKSSRSQRSTPSIRSTPQPSKLSVSPSKKAMLLVPSATPVKPTIRHHKNAYTAEERQAVIEFLADNPQAFLTPIRSPDEPKIPKYVLWETFRTQLYSAGHKTGGSNRTAAALQEFHRLHSDELEAAALQLLHARRTITSELSVRPGTCDPSRLKHPSLGQGDCVVL